MDFPEDNWGADVNMLVSGRGRRGDGGRTLTRCRLVGLELPDGLLPGLALGASAAGGDDSMVGVIVKPPLGLAPAQVADVAAAPVAGGARFVKDDDASAILGGAAWPCGSARPALAALGDGLAADNVRAQVEEAGRGGLLLLLGSRAYAEPGGLEAAVARAVASVDR